MSSNKVGQFPISRKDEHEFTSWKLLIHEYVKLLNERIKKPAYAVLGFQFESALWSIVRWEPIDPDAQNETETRFEFRGSLYLASELHEQIMKAFAELLGKQTDLPLVSEAVDYVIDATNGLAQWAKTGFVPKILSEDEKEEDRVAWQRIAEYEKAQEVKEQWKREYAERRTRDFVKWEEDK